MEAVAQYGKQITKKTMKSKKHVVIAASIAALYVGQVPSSAFLGFEGERCVSRTNITCHLERAPTDEVPGLCSKTDYVGCKDCEGGIWHCNLPPPGDTSCVTKVYQGEPGSGGCFGHCDLLASTSAGPTGCTN